MQARVYLDRNVRHMKLISSSRLLELAKECFRANIFMVLSAENGRLKLDKSMLKDFSLLSIAISIGCPFSRKHDPTTDLYVELLHRDQWIRHILTILVCHENLQ